MWAGGQLHSVGDNLDKYCALIETVPQTANLSREGGRYPDVGKGCWLTYRAVTN